MAEVTEAPAEAVGEGEVVRADGLHAEFLEQFERAAGAR